MGVLRFVGGVANFDTNHLYEIIVFFEKWACPLMVQHFIHRVRQLPYNRRTWSRTCAKFLAYVTYVGKYQKAYIRRYTFYLVIFLTIFPKFVLTWIEWKITTRQKLIQNFHFKKIHALTLTIKLWFFQWNSSSL